MARGNLPPLIPCSVCGGPGYKNLGAGGRCWYHYGEFLRLLDTKDFNGVGLPVTPRPLDEYGTMFFNLECSCCSATWAGMPGESCPWCARAYNSMLEWQHDLALRPPDVDLDDKHRPEALRAWVKRMAVQVEAGTIEKEEADLALARELKRK